MEARLEGTNKKQHNPEQELQQCSSSNTAIRAAQRFGSLTTHFSEQGLGSPPPHAPYLPSSWVRILVMNSKLHSEQLRKITILHLSECTPNKLLNFEGYRYILIEVGNSIGRFI